MTSSDDFKDALRGIFDSQIPNYGDYNLVYASNEHRGDNNEHRGDNREGQHGGRSAKYYVVGYRWQPAEIVVAPFNAKTLTPGGDPTEINMTNLSHAFELADGDYEVGTSTGKTFRFGVDPVDAIPSGIPTGTPSAGPSAGPSGTPSAGPESNVDQREDHEDFVAFMAAFVAMS